MGDPGDPGDPGEPGAPGTPGAPGRSSVWTSPGLAVEITAVDIDPAGRAQATFRVTDGDGEPLDVDGRFTQGAISASFIIASLQADAAGRPLYYTAYTTRDQTSPITQITATQAGIDAGGSTELVDAGTGTYRYAFAAPVVPADPSATHTVGITATRTVDGVRHVANAVYHFVPAGTEVVTTRSVVETASCNGCHGELEAHGGSRTQVEVCILCHSPQTIDPDTGNTVSFPVMIHKIHAGESLPSVEAGIPYQIIGFRQSVHDYSSVAFPRDIKDCGVCHTGPDGDLGQTRPSRAACGSCHDLVDFSTDAPAAPFVAHFPSPQPDDANCTTCHPPAGGLSGVADKHTGPSFGPGRPDLVFEIGSVSSTGPGQTPQLRFAVRVDGVARDILAEPLDQLTVTVAGPTTDIASYWQYRIQGGPAVGTLVAAGSDFLYTFPSPMPADAAGSYAFGLEGRATINGVRRDAVNPFVYAAVTDTAAVPRRQVVELAKCNSCHGELAEHGGSRRDPNYCVFCHHPNNTNDDRAPRFEVNADGTPFAHVAPSVDFKVMIHKIHRGEELTQQPYELGGFPLPSVMNPGGTPINFGETLFPGETGRCETCHLPGTYGLPLTGPRLWTRSELLTCAEDPLADADDFCAVRTSVESLTPPETAVCTSCHDAPHTVAHATIMTTPAGVESCATCHGPGREFDVAAVHTPPL